MTRILTALVLTPTVVWAVLWAPAWVLVAVTALVGLGAYYEFDNIAAAQGIAKTGWPGMVAGLAVLLIPEPALPIAVIAALVLMALNLGAVELSEVLPSVATGMLGVLYIFGAWRCAIMLRDANPHWLMIALLVSWAGDTAAMYVGKAWGRRKLAPRISPGKTVEGSIGSVAGGTFVALVYAYFFIPDASLGLVMAVAMAANIAGQIGDLCESAFKRGAGVKDSGTMLPGHGGWLDRVDSSLFSIPVVYAVLRVITASRF
ncbi:MAG: phosphatidate cytidylyltransferase [Acidobacteriota bacterium]